LVKHLQLITITQLQQIYTLLKFHVFVFAQINKSGYLI